MILEEIVSSKQKKLNKIKSKNSSLIDKLREDSLTIIAEIKKASPSKGIIQDNFRPETQLKKYEQGGAGAVSILTEEEFFKGSCNLFANLRKKTDLPLLRKDFIIDPLQIYQSKLIGADVILLIAAILDLNQIRSFLKITQNLGMEAIVEVHNKDELDKVINTEARIIGINNRNLKDFSVDLKNTSRLINYLEQKNIRKNYQVIAESGIKSRDDINFLNKTGINGVLIGETLMKSPNASKLIMNFKK
ncbi:MAG: indole-3-glycerol phosphate synthase TrpC [Halanaerobiaceae bacterium]